MHKKEGWRWQVYLEEGVGEYREWADSIAFNGDGGLSLYKHTDDGKELSCVVGKGYWKFVRHERVVDKEELERKLEFAPNPATIEVGD